LNYILECKVLIHFQGHQFVLMGTAESSAALETAQAEASSAPVVEKPSEVVEVSFPYFLVTNQYIPWKLLPVTLKEFQHLR
jgi:hypothetical protein